MDVLPPNDPNRNNNNNNTTNPSTTKSDPTSNSPNNNAPIEVFGDIQDSPIVVAMFFVGVVTWFLRERCIC